MAELLVLNRLSYPRERPEPNVPTIYFTSVNGTVYVSKRTCELLGLLSGDRIEIVCTKTPVLRIGVRKTKSVNGFRVHPKRAGMCFSAANLVHEILTMTGRTKSITLRLAETPADGILWTLPGSIDRRTFA